MRCLFYLLIACIISNNGAFAQQMVTRTIKSFGAKGDGKTNDTDAFEKASAFFNKRGGKGKLIIDAGTFIVGRQTVSNNNKDVNKYYYSAKNILDLKNIKDFSIEGKKKSIIKYTANLKYGSFDPETGKAFRGKTKDFAAINYGANIGACIYLEKCYNVKVSNVVLNGNNPKLIYGGIWGDKGIQLHHIGVFMITCKNIVVENVNASYFGLDGITVWNFSNDTTDNIKILGSTFEYNSRQGLSWIGGNQLYVKNCQFNYTGKSAYASPPSAEMDIEAAGTSVRNGTFENCAFIDNIGCGMVSDQGDNAGCRFINCTFWGY